MALPFLLGGIAWATTPAQRTTQPGAPIDTEVVVRVVDKWGPVRDGHRVVTGEGRVQRGRERLQVLVGHRVLDAGHGRGDAVAGCEQQVDDVATHVETTVTQTAQKVFAAVRHLKDAVETEHARGALDGVRVTEQAADHLTRRRM